MDKIFRDKRYIPLLASITALGWSLAYPLIKVGYGAFGIAAGDLGSKVLFAGFRFFGAGLLVLCFCRARRVKLNLQAKSGIAWLLLLALVNTAMRYLFAYIGLGYNASGRSTILDSMCSFFLILLSAIFFRDDRFTPGKVIGCLLGMAGIIAINIQPGVNFFQDITFMGDGMILLNALSGAVGGIITRLVSNKMHMMSATGWSMLLGGAMLILVSPAFGAGTPWTITVKGILVLFALILISAVGFGIYNELISYHPISRVAIFNAMIPVLGVIFASLLLKEPLKWQYFVAVAVVAAGIYLVNHKKPERK